ncbi:hypothetical protein YC2023_056024 [Brassica napus]
MVMERGLWRLLASDDNVNNMIKKLLLHLPYLEMFFTILVDLEGWKTSGVGKLQLEGTRELQLILLNFAYTKVVCMNQIVN